MPQDYSLQSLNVGEKEHAFPAEPDGDSEAPL